MKFISILFLAALLTLSFCATDNSVCIDANVKFFTKIEYSYWAVYNTPTHTLNFRLVSLHPQLSCLTMILNCDKNPAYSKDITANAKNQTAENKVPFVSLFVDLTLQEININNLCSVETVGSIETYTCKFNIKFKPSYEPTAMELVVMTFNYLITFDTVSQQQIAIVGQPLFVGVGTVKSNLTASFSLLVSNERSFTFPTNYTGNFTFLDNVYIREKCTEASLASLYNIKITEGRVICGNSFGRVSPDVILDEPGWTDWSFQMKIVGSNCYMNWTSILYKKQSRALSAENRILADSDYGGSSMSYTITINSWGVLLKISIGVLAFLLLLV